MLRTQNTSIVDANSRTVHLRGVNLGGWLMMEGYILHAPNRAEQLFKENFAKILSVKALRQFEEDFCNQFIQENDFKNIARLGFNCVRVPFNHRLIEKIPYKYDAHGLSFLDRAISWAKKYRIYVILDLHGACGAQNHDWHSDSLGKAALWTKESYRQRTYALWEFLADRYKNEEWVAGYDILNEAVTHDVRGLNNFYKNTIKAIRGIDRNHILFVEGNKWAQDIACLEEFDDDNYVLSVHYYMPLEYTFNLVPQLSYPLKNFGKANTKKALENYQKISKKRKVPIYVGEFGVNARQGFYGEHQWLKDVLNCFDEFGFHWTYWTYKAIKNSIFPDGIFSYVDNAPWINRAGPLQGWETYHLHWPSQRRAMIRSWQTQTFLPNTHILNVLKNVNRTHQ